ncbi:MAG: hypothetical protein ACYT04_95535, partial [Nostoc sp.]
KIEKPKKFPSYSQTAIAFGRLPPPMPNAQCPMPNAQCPMLKDRADIWEDWGNFRVTVTRVMP